ncbi:phenylacetate--CoA ligase family protein [Pseudochryseolinea flava]|uniref:Phenylacetate--CoA ligase family protein n=1 Tax=Pseudochryseolinea flava TaxID=2059302 RepID=A0A364Y0G2_9BACT|nr:AMP-binding protein [Pseudochryseolinea flava]RAW00159.1 phenylacetate--CoA ligase family protein [Pseudochryseolinea flava]
MNLTPDIEFASAHDIAAMQYEKLTALLSYLQTHSPFYQRHFSKHAIDLNAVKSIADLASITPVTKDDLQRENWDFICVPRHKIVEYTSTSGTLGKPVTVPLSANDIKRLAYNEAISFACADGDKHDLYQLMLTMDRQFMAGLAYFEGIRQLGAGLIRVGPGLPAMQWEVIHRLQPTAIVAVPSFVVKLLEYAVQHGIDPNKTSVKKVICIGESIRTADLSLNALGQKITAQWNVVLFGTYAATEMQTAFPECRHGRGGHLHPELIIVEILDDDNNVVKPGQAGEVTITTLGVEAMPLLRYKTGDIAKAFVEPCACGRNTIRLSPVLGRKQHMLKVKGTTLFPPAIFEVLNKTRGVRDYVVEVTDSALGTDELMIYVLAEEENEPVSKQLLSAFQSQLRVVPALQFVDPRALEELQGVGTNRKVSRFMDRRSINK